jgi:hypothetical protein
MAQTARIAELIGGQALYQKRARQALPLLVRQAEVGQTIFYSDLAEELGMSNPRTLNYPLGCIGRTLESLSKSWREPIPPIQCLVVNKNTGLPGEGIAWFLIKENDFGSLTRPQKREIIKAELSRIFIYSRWHEVLEALSLPYVSRDFSTRIEQAATFGGGEGERHRILKEFIAKNPEIIGLATATPHGKTELPLASGDFLDVSFESKGEWTAAEVKPLTSPVLDIMRGLFQCVKYRAVMEAVQATSGRDRNARAVLVLEGTLSVDLIPIRNILGIEVIESVVP